MRQRCALRIDAMDSWQSHGDGIVREYAPASAQVDTFASGSYFYTPTGFAGGPDLAPGTTHVLRFWNNKSAGADAIIFGYGANNEGWYFNAKNTTGGIGLRAGTNTTLSTDYIERDGVNVVVITRLADGSIRHSLNGGPAKLSSASPTYAMGTSASKVYLGRSNPGVGTFPAPLIAFIAYSRLARAASDAELVAWSRTDTVDLYHQPSAVLSDAALDFDIHAEGWDGSASSWAFSRGSITLTKAGTPAKTTLAAETVYTIPAAMFHDSQKSVDVYDRGSFARVVFDTEATSRLQWTFRDTGSVWTREFAVLENGVFKTVKIVSGADIVGGNPRFVSSPVALTAGSKRITLVEGCRDQGGTGPYYGDGVTTAKLRAPSSQPITFVAPTRPSTRLLVVGDSISVGIKATVPETDAWPVLIRGIAPAGWGVTSDGWNASSIYDRTKQPAWMAASVARWSALLDGTSANILWFALGTNDWGIGLWVGNTTAYSNHWGAVFDAIRAARPDVTIIAQTPILATVDDSPSSQQPWREAIVTAAAARGIRYVRGELWTDLEMADHLHPSTAGYATYAGHVRTELSI